MNQKPLNILRDWINTQGIRVCEDPRRVEAYLKDFCGTDKREIFVLVQAMRQNVVADLRQGPTPPFTADVFKARLVQRLYDNLGLDEDIARWAVEGWRFVLGIEDVMPTGISPAAKAPKKPATRRKKASVPTQPATAATPPRIAKRYEISADGEEVIDHHTGLIWRRAVEVTYHHTGLIWRRTVESRYFTFDSAQVHARQVALQTGVAWRVPTIDELKTLIDKKRTKRGDSPVIDTDFFPERAGEWFWSSSPCAGYADYAWYVSFNIGGVGSYSRHNAGAVRLVRGG